MKYTTLGKTGLNVSALTVGSWQLGGPLAFDGKPDGHPDPGKEQVIRMMRELGDMGINSIDTAEQYSAGESERRVGEAIQGQRDQWVVTSKFGYRVGPNNVRIDDSSPATILPSLDGSLKRLGTDYLDVYLYHCAPDLADLEQGRAVLEAAKQAGKIRAYGVSTAHPSLVRSLLEKDSVDVVQFPSSLIDENAEIWEMAQAQQLGTQVRGVMASGRLSGKYFGKNASWRADDNRSNWFKDADFKAYAALEEYVPEGMTMAQAAIRWTLDHCGCHTICMGAKNMDDYRAAVAAVEMSALPADVSEALQTCAQQIG